MGLAGILVALFFLIWLAYRGGSALLLAPAAALVAAAAAREPLLATWTQTFMRSAAQFVAQFFPIFLLGAVFGKLMEVSGSISAIAQFVMDKLGRGLRTWRGHRDRCRFVAPVYLPHAYSPQAGSLTPAKGRPP
jgi:H+/gluconate symporter-like permease